MFRLDSLPTTIQQKIYRYVFDYALDLLVFVVDFKEKAKALKRKKDLEWLVGTLVWRVVTDDTLTNKSIIGKYYFSDE